MRERGYSSGSGNPTRTRSLYGYLLDGGTPIEWEARNSRIVAAVWSAWSGTSGVVRDELMASTELEQ